MVPATEQDQVLEVGRSAVDPVLHMVAVAHRGRALAARPAAVPVARLEGPAEASRDDPLGASDIDRHRLLAEQHPGDAAVAGHALHRGGGDGQGELHLRPRRPGQTLEGLDGGRDLEVGRPAAAGQLDQGIGIALLLSPCVVLARRPSQRLQGAAHRRPAEGVEHAADQKTAVLGLAQAQAALLHQVLLLAVVARGIDRVLVVLDLVVELARRALLGQGQELRLLEHLGQLLGRPSHGRQVGKADLAPLHGRDGLRQLGLLLAHGQGIPGRVGVHVAVEAHPVGRAVEAFLIPLPAGRELGRKAGEVELQAVDEVAQAGEHKTALDEAFGDQLEHASSLPN